MSMLSLLKLLMGFSFELFNSIYYRVNTHMLFVKRLKFTPPPWRIFCSRRGRIVDQNDRTIAVIPKPGEVEFEQRTANLNLIATAPELLAALLEAAYTLDMQGTPLNPQFYELINRARGPKFEPLKPSSTYKGPAVSP
jgi:hypothetical protein